MRTDPFRFFRGTCHLFYEDLPANVSLRNSPPAWVCGDLHLENFGSYKADNRIVYFDINDFDESCLAPCLFDVSRAMTSILVAGDSLKLSKKMALQLALIFLMQYRQTLSTGHARLVQTETAVGAVRRFMKSLAKRKRRLFLNKRSVIKQGRRKLIIDDIHVSRIPKEQKKKITKVYNQWVAKQDKPGFYKLIDIGYRIAGTGSLGLERYVLLVEGTGSPEGNYLLDLKVSSPSSVRKYTGVRQPKWPDEATRITTIEKRLQAFPPALLKPFVFQKKNFVLRELQPTQDKINLSESHGSVKELTLIVQTLAQVLAWDQLRSAGRQGSANADALIEFAKEKGWVKPLVNYVMNYKEKVIRDYEAFVVGYEEGFFGK